MTYTLQFSQVLPFLPYLLGGAWITLLLTVYSFSGGALLGLAIALGIRYGSRRLGVVLEGYVSFFVNIPQLVTVLFIFFVLGEFRIFISPFSATVAGLALAEAAYLAQIFRSGFDSVRRSELDAAEVLGLRRPQVVRYVLLPHLSKVLFPPLANQFILCTLLTSVGAIVGVEELSGRTLNVESQTFRSLEVFSITAGIYLVITLLLTLALQFVGQSLFRVRIKVF
jgi:polar amino acid transport system permease protein